MAKKRLNQCRTSRDFIRYARKQDGVDVVDAKGCRVKICTDKGTGIIHDHPAQDMGRGLRCAVVKQFIAIGILPIIVFAFLIAIK